MNIPEPSRPPPSQQRSRLPKYTSEKHDSDLYEALEDWREEKTAVIYGRGNLNDLGPSLIMPSAILDRIIDAAHHYKIRSAQDLRKETGWTDSELYGDEVVAIIQRHAASLPSPFITTPLSFNYTNMGSPYSAPMYSPFPLAISVPGPIIAPFGDKVANVNQSLAVPKRHNKCSACGQEGHNGMFAITGLQHF